jgi:hypothetical protein
MCIKTWWMAALAVLAVSGGTAEAVPIISSRTGLVAPFTTIDFSEVAVADNTPLTTQFAGFGVTFSDLFYNACPASCVVTPPSGAKPDIENFPDANSEAFVPSSTLSFTAPVDGAAFQWAPNGGASYTLSAYLGATLVESFSVSVDTNAINGVSGWGYYGFDGIVLDRIVIAAGNAFLIDNLETGSPVPEPTTLLLLGSGVIGVLRRVKRGAARQPRATRTQAP